ncbi:uncharacterized protein (DUF1697 family) [Saccharopolyspora erythraea NRRL 2338]|uniref:Uncharacterized protein n=2 Tax=Saccharopolyspora erythraea TaxID=1836 RepID=A4FG47_SACEN|nr:DUF1697 domain-containing protein [Saccharopolyspora erythraea]EQD85478.1 hypothetical protein N599_14505 [Saccharopolyspora erythraea D]PFG96727.1 uncharacterized protein (DUF1697 family) [Saccharopolyspora erythraea NRRL 2338]QRK86980.1 DUF1697 domain-containing protein [Saccharopolyspora erythraea]CAM03022.1 protein of unknown function DUF1697 [Saccharopolyspora erythraea NRRL 2338]
MSTHIALLRGINVGGRTNIAMADLRAVFQELGCEPVATYLRSGNVVFIADDPGGVAAEVQNRVAARLGVSTLVQTRSAEEFARVAAGHPFLERETDLAKLHVVFLDAEPDPRRQAGLEVPGGGREQFRFAGRELYLHYPDGAGRSRFTNAYLEKQLGVSATARNWKTVLTLAEMAARV